MRKIFIVFISTVFIISCKKDIKNEGLSASEDGLNRRLAQISICHKVSPLLNLWTTLLINEQNLATHLAHGDVVPDRDKDGFTKANPCHIGAENDCNDNNASVNPSAAEVCNNGIDDNCNGVVDENCFATVTICGKTWMLHNLSVSNYRNGDPIPQATSVNDWAVKAPSGAWAYPLYNPINGLIYGKLYSWKAVSDPRGLAPAGWHIATDAEWTDLANCLGGSLVAGGKIKETGTVHWVSPNTGATNSSGFTALPAGRIEPFGQAAMTPGNYGFWWTSSISQFNGYSLGRHADFNSAELFSFHYTTAFGFSVRCVKD